MNVRWWIDDNYSEKKVDEIGCLEHQRLTRDSWTLSTVRGYQLPLCHWPTARATLTNYTWDHIQEKALEEKISSLVQKEAVVPVRDPQGVVMVSPLFVAPKNGGGWRPIINLRELNQFLIPPHFKMEGLHMLPSVLQTNMHMVKIDLKYAYLTIPVASKFHLLLAFRNTQGNYFQFTVLPFGLCTAPYVFTKLTRPVVQFLCNLGINIVIYLDDMLISAMSQDSLRCHLATVLWLLVSLGFIINVPKSVLGPATQIEFLGFSINTTTMSIALPTGKVAEIQKETAHLLQQSSVPTKGLARLVGKLVATRPVIFTAPLHYRALQSVQITAVHAHQELCPLSPEAMADLNWWKCSLHLHCSSPIVKSEASMIITSDASLKGWGAAYQEEKTGGLWTVEEAQSHINLLELKAAYLALQCFLKEKKSVSVLIRMDNQTAISYVNRMGSPSLSLFASLHWRYGIGAFPNR